MSDSVTSDKNRGLVKHYHQTYTPLPRRRPEGSFFFFFEQVLARPYTISRKSNGLDRSDRLTLLTLSVGKSTPRPVGRGAADVVFTRDSFAVWFSSRNDPRLGLGEDGVCKVHS